MHSEPNSEKPQPTSSATGQSGVPTILLVEDNHANRVLIRTYIDGFGYRPTLVHSGEDALEFVKHTPCDLVLMDIQMPGMDGVQTTHEIRALGGRCQALPIIALTASAGATAATGFLAAGLDDVVTKPIDPVDLLAKIQRFVGAPPAPQ